MNHAGEIRYLTQLARPTWRSSTTRAARTSNSSARDEAIARAKGEIFEGLEPGGIAVINADDRFAPLWRELAGGRARVEFGLEHAADGHRHLRAARARKRHRADDAGRRTSARDARCARACTTCATRSPRQPPQSRSSPARARSRPGSSASPASRDGCSESGLARRDADRRHLQRESRFDARSDRGARPRAGHEASGAGRHGRARSARRRSCTRSSARYARERGHRSPVHARRTVDAARLRRSAPARRTTRASKIWSTDAASTRSRRT